MAGHERFMRMALRAALRARGYVEPNPVVGAVMVRNGQVLAVGHHRRFGGPHAEIQALRRCRQLGHDPAGADVYVTLEPCGHWGKTPPCTEALIAAKVRRVFAAMQDPNPLVAGKGLEQLRAAGIEVQLGLGEARARDVLRAYVKRTQTGMPWVVAKWAQTLDGAVATASGESRWISGPTSRAWVHRLRGRVDAVMVGIGTVLADDPRLTARGRRARRVARRVVVDSRLRIPLHSELVRTAKDAPVLVATTAQAMEVELKRLEALRGAGVEVMAFGPGAGQVDLPALLLHLSQDRGATNVLVEGGPTLLGQLFGQNLVDEAVVFLAPRLLGDKQARPAVVGLTPRRLAEALRLTIQRIKPLGQDTMLVYRTMPPSSRGRSDT